MLMATEEHRRVQQAICAKLRSWRSFVVAVDGIDGAGKSTLSRYLAWQLEMPAIGTDLYLNGEEGELEYRLEDLKSVIAGRLERNRPVIVEGLQILRTLAALNIKPDFIIWVDQVGREASRGFVEVLKTYQEEFRPLERADYIFRFEPVDESGCEDFEV